MPFHLIDDFEDVGYGFYFNRYYQVIEMNKFLVFQNFFRVYSGTSEQKLLFRVSWAAATKHDCGCGWPDHSNFQLWQTIVY